MIYTFAGFTLDIERRELSRANVIVNLEPKVYQVLVYLIEHRHRLIPKEELVEQCWAGIHVSDNAVARCIRALRRALDDSRQTQSMIQTQHRQGYRFIADVTEQSEITDGEDEIEPLSAPGDEAGPGVIAQALSETVVRSSDNPPVAQHEERRYLTVLCIGLAGLSPLPDSLELEDYRDVILTYQALVTDIVGGAEGTMVQEAGESMAASFGYPLAHEDDARRAVEAALEIVTAMNAMSTRLEREHGVTLAIHLGLHSGQVVIEGQVDQASPTPFVLGDALPVARRIQQVSAPNTVVISGATYHLVQGYFHGEPLEAVHLEERLAALALHQVIAATGAQSRMDVIDAQHATHFMGREAERTLLLERWSLVEDGMGQVVLIRGEPGIGKSRLVREMKRDLAMAACTWIESRSTPDHQHSAWSPVVTLCEQWLQWQPEDTEAVKHDKLAKEVERLSVPQAEARSLLARLLALPDVEDRSSLHILTPQQRRDKLLETLVAMVLDQTSSEPVVLVMEDLHWMDASTLAFLTLLMEHVSTTRLYLVLTARPEFDVPWGLRSYRTDVTLSRLSPSEIEEMVEGLTEDKRLTVDAIQHVVDQSDGVPLFIEELTMAMVARARDQEVESGEAPLSGQVALSVPATLYESLMLRLDRLGVMAKSVAQLSAVLGRQFAADELSAASPWQESDLSTGLTQLMDAELVYPWGLPSQRSYVFKHALIRDAAYESLVRETRRDYHERIAKALEAQFASIVATQPERLAYHYTEAQHIETAIMFWHKAGELAGEHYADAEAAGYLRKALDLLAMLPVTPEHQQRELGLQLLLGAALRPIKSPSSPEVEQVYARARELCEEREDSPELCVILYGLCWYYIMANGLPIAQELGERLLSIARVQKTPELLFLAHQTMGMVLYMRCQYIDARAHLEQAIALADPTQEQALTLLYSFSPMVSSLSTLAVVLSHLGYPNQAYERALEGVDVAQDLAHPASLGLAQFQLITYYKNIDRTDLVLESSREYITLSEETGQVLVQAIGRFYEGWAIVDLGRREAGLIQMRKRLANLFTLGAESVGLWHMVVLAEGYGLMGQVEEGLQTLQDVSSRWGNIGQPPSLVAQANIVKGRLLMGYASPDVIQAEACFLRALDLSHAHQAKLFELRAATSLARLWQSQGKRQEAYDLLAPVYGWFTEGFDIAYIRDAKVLLDELAPLDNPV